MGAVAAGLATLGFVLRHDIPAITVRTAVVLKPSDAFASIVSVRACASALFGAHRQCSNGTGWSVAPGLFVTDAHVVGRLPGVRSGADEELVDFDVLDADFATHRAQVLRADAAHDVAVLRADLFLPSLVLGDTAPSPGAGATAICSGVTLAITHGDDAGPQGLAMAGRIGTIIHPDVAGYPPTLINLEGIVVPHGCSGGPVIVDGGVAAVLEAQSAGASQAIPAAQVRDLLYG
ncbi:MAG TPA: serine protease [Candidatus Sulfotelmatobacter sp.]|nr:serine protease [Candidatus Sulfotelmatobacter sp.]